jgi:hypothetical protein
LRKIPQRRYADTSLTRRAAPLLPLLACLLAQGLPAGHRQHADFRRDIMLGRTSGSTASRARRLWHFPSGASKVACARRTAAFANLDVRGGEAGRRRSSPPIREPWRGSGRRLATSSLLANNHTAGCRARGPRGDGALASKRWASPSPGSNIPPTHRDRPSSEPMDDQGGIPRVQLVGRRLAPE